MKSPTTENLQIRAYLLGQLDPESEDVEQVDERLLTDQEFSHRVELIEDELVEQYLEHDLTPVERAAFEHHFLRPVERQERLRTARLIHHRLSFSTGSPSLPVASDPLDGTRLLWMQQPRTWLALAAGVILAASLAGLWSQHRSKNVGDTTATQHVSLGGGLVASNEAPPGSTGSVVLFVPGTVRSADEKIPPALTELHLEQHPETIHFVITLTSSSIGPYSVELLHGDIRRSLASHRAVPIPGGATLSVDVPSSLVAPGVSTLAVTPPSGGSIYYSFIAH